MPDQTSRRVSGLSNLLVPNLLFGLALCMCVVLSGSLHATVASFAIMILYFLWLLYAAPAILIKYFVFAFAVATNVLGCFVIETCDISLYEIAVDSSFAGSLPLLVFSRWLFFAVLAMLEMIFCQHRSNLDEQGGIKLAKTTAAKPPMKWLEILNMVVFALIVILFIRIMPYPSFLSGLDRFMYTDVVNTGIWGQLSNNLAYLVVIPALAARYNKSKMGIAAIGIYLLFLFWTGHKFGGYFDFLYMLMLVYFDKLSLMDFKKLSRYLFLLVVLTGMVICFAAFANSFVSSKGSIQFLCDRAAQQGQLWWRTYDKLDESFYPEQIENEIQSILSQNLEIRNNVRADYGIYKIMYYASDDPAVIDRKLASGSRYSEAAYALMLYCFGPIGPCLLSFAGALMVGLVVNSFLYAIRRGYLIDSVIWLRFLALVRGILGAFALANFFTPFTMLTFGYLCFSALCHLNSQKEMLWRRVVGGRNRVTG